MPKAKEASASSLPWIFRDWCDDVHRDCQLRCFQRCLWLAEAIATLSLLLQHSLLIGTVEVTEHAFVSVHGLQHLSATSKAWETIAEVTDRVVIFRDRWIGTLQEVTSYDKGAQSLLGPLGHELLVPCPARLIFGSMVQKRLAEFESVRNLVALECINDLVPAFQHISGSRPHIHHLWSFEVFKRLYRESFHPKTDQKQHRFELLDLPIMMTHKHTQNTLYQVLYANHDVLPLEKSHKPIEVQAFID